jgi:NAD(P)H-hydrate epimerase
MQAMNEPKDNPPPPRRLTRAQSRAVDRHAIKTLGLPGLVLMENAGLNAAGAIMDLLKQTFILDEDSARVALVCGGGNNGGDGYVIARHLLAWGLRPTVYAVKPPAELDGDAAVNAHAWLKLGQPVHELKEQDGWDKAIEDWRCCHAIVDAVLGTGFGDEQAPMRDRAAAAVRAINRVRADGEAGRLPLLAGGAQRGRVVAIDVPSGLDADTGRPAGNEAGEATRADLTVTFVAEKAGFGEPEAATYLGRVVVADIGLPDSAVAAALNAA